MDELPIEVLYVIFGHFDAKTCIGCRLVCQKWQRTAGAGGCAFLRVSRGSLNARQEAMVGSISLMGSTSEDVVESSCQQNKRTRGHLPEPSVLIDKQQQAFFTFSRNLATFAAPSSRVPSNDVPTMDHVFAFKLESNDNISPLVSLDLEKSTFQVATIPLLHPQRKLKKAVEVLSLSGCRHLKRLSIRGCASLDAVYLPPSIVALDASGCTSLTSIYIPRGIYSERLIALNLNGCRNLEPSSGSLFGPHTKEAMKIVVDMDASATHPRLAPALSGALQATKRLETLSLRYSATDSIIMALAKSVSARESLRLLDVAFSTELTDAAVEALVASAPKLERFNLRGCKKVSAECYNKIPVLLMNRQIDGSGNATVSNSSTDSNSGDTTTRAARKGDNIFHFVASEPSKRPKR